MTNNKRLIKTNIKTNMSTKKFGIVAGLVFALSIVLSPAASACSLQDLSSCDNDGLMALIVQMLAGQTTTTTTTTTTPTITGIPAGFQFNTNLKLGSTGNDVKYLQIFLNSDSATAVGNAGSETSYFGSMTQAAVVKFQNKYASEVLTPYGLTAGTGFFGTSSRAKANAMISSGTTTPVTTLPEGCTSTSGFSPVTGASCSTGAVTTLPEGCTSTSGFSPVTGASCSTGVVATGDYTVYLAAGQPTGTLASGSAYNTMLKVNVSAGASTQTITSVTVERTGLSLDSNVDGVLVADEDGVRYGNIITLASGKATISFPSQPITVAAGTSKTILVQYNLVSGNMSGTIGAKVTAMSGSPAGLPLVGSTFNLVDGSNTLGAFTVAKKDVTTGAAVTKDIGTIGYDIAKFTLAETSSKEDIYLDKLTVYQNGTAADGDVTNIKLVAYDGTVLSTVASTTNREATFDLSSNPYKIGKGVSRDFTIRIDIASGSSRTVQFTVQNNYDVVVRGADTGMGILSSSSFPVGNDSNVNTVQINAGSLLVSRDSTSPSGTISIGSQDVVLATYKFEARGEDIELRTIKAEIVGSTLATTDFSGTVRLVTEDGQSIASIATGATLIATSTGTGATITLSPYYTIPAGQSKKISVVVDTSSTMNTSDQPVASIKDVYYKKVLTNSYATTATSWIPGNTMTASQGTLTIGKNAALGNSNKVKGQNEVKIGSYLLQTNSTEGVNVSSIAIKLMSTTNEDITGISNLMIKNGSTLLGQSVSSPAVGKNGGYGVANSINVAGQLNIPASTTVQLDVYADLGSSTNAANITSEIDTDGVTGTGSISSASVTGPSSAKVGQSMTLVAGGTLEVSIDTSAAPASQFLVGGPGLSGIEMAKIKLYGTIEDMKVERLELKSVNGAGNIAQVKLLGTGLSTDPTASLLAGVATFTFPGGSEILVPAYSTKIITVAVDTTNVGTIVAGNLGVIGFGTMNVKGAGSSNTVLETVTGTSYVAGTDDYTYTLGDILYFTKTAASGTHRAPGYYMATTTGGGANLTSDGVFLNGGDEKTVFTAGDKVTKLTGTTDTIDGGNKTTQAYAKGDVVFVHDADTLANNGFYIVTTAVSSGTDVSAANALVKGLTLVAADQVTKLTNANALFSNTVQFEEVKPIISKNSSSPAGTTSGTAEQIVAMFDVKAEGQRDLSFSSLTLEKGGNNDPSKNVSKFYLYNGGTKLAEVASTSVEGATSADNAVAASTVTMMEGASDGSDKIGTISAAEYATWKVGDTLTITDGTTTNVVTITTLPTYDATGVGVVFSGTVTLAHTKTVNIYNNRVHFASDSSTSLGAQTITAGQTMTLTVKADTQNVKTGAASGTTVNFTMSVPGSTGPLQTTAGGLTWTYTKLGSGTAYAGTLTDSYPVMANTLSY